MDALRCSICRLKQRRMPKSNPEKDPILYKSQYESEEKTLNAARQKIKENIFDALRILSRKMY